MIVFAIPGDIGTATGGYVYARRLIAEWASGDLGCMTLPLSASFPFPDAAALEMTRRMLAARPSRLLVDGLAYGAFPEALAAEIGPGATVLLHHPLCDETGLPEAEAARLFEAERAALAHARNVVVTSEATGRDIVDRFGVAKERVTVAEPGLDRAAPASLNGDPPRILAVGSLTPRKGYRDLVAALADCADHSWTCEIVGAEDRDAEEAVAIRAQIESAGLGARIRLSGPMSGDELAERYAAADLFVTASHHEGYGMAVAEAMAHGLPILATRAGALPETAPAAAFVDAGDRAALTHALTALLDDPDRRRAMGAESHRIARARPSWAETARIVAGATAPR